MSTSDEDFVKQRQAKVSLLRHTRELLAPWQERRESEAQWQPSPQEKVMQAILGIILAGIGGFTVVFLGLPQAFVVDFEKASVALFLIFGGEVAVFSGAWLTKYYYSSNPLIGKILFGAGFALSVGVLIVGLINVFSAIGVSMFLVVVGFMGAFAAALALR